MEMKLLKKLKFAMLLSLVTVVGIQAGEARQVNCPHVADIGPPTQGTDGFLHYTATSTFIFKGSTTYPVTLKNATPYALMDTTPQGNRAVCSYNGQGGGAGLWLRADDVATQHCTPQGSGGYFDCP